MWGPMLKLIFQTASLIGLGATFERWFSPGDDGSNDQNPWAKIWPLLFAAAAIVFLYKLIGKKFTLK